MRVTEIKTYVFFFSTRRRHTRFWRDWSSDVCSSDLRQCQRRLGLANSRGTCQQEHADRLARILEPRARGLDALGDQVERSEERRVGKEGRSRWSPYH